MRRRVSAEEQKLVEAAAGPIRDIRQTAEVIERVDRLLLEWPKAPARFAKAVMEDPF